MITPIEVGQRLTLIKQSLNCHIPYCNRTVALVYHTVAVHVCHRKNPEQANMLYVSK